MSQESQPEPKGNTKTFGNQLYVWVFTLPRDSCTPYELSQNLLPHCKKFRFQHEIGESGYEHYQGIVSLKIKERMDAVKQIIGCNKVHLEQCMDTYKAWNYAGKIETRVAGPWDQTSSWIDIIKELRPWQLKLEKELSTAPDDRTIIWYTDKVGGAGKTRFSKYMAITHGAVVFNNAGFGDLAYALPDNPKVVIINLTRSTEERLNYSAIEAIKDGLMFSKKYESKMKIFNCPHVVIFSNYNPDLEKMSKDRWSVRSL